MIHSPSAATISAISCSRTHSLSTPCSSMMHQNQKIGRRTIRAAEGVADGVIVVGVVGEDAGVGVDVGVDDEDVVESGMVVVRKRSAATPGGDAF